MVLEVEPSRENSRHSCHKVFNLHMPASTLQLAICDGASSHTGRLLDTSGLLGGRMKQSYG